MIKKLTKSELSVLLTQRNKTKYIYDLNVLHNVGNPNLAVTDMYGYCVDNDIIIVSIYCFNGCEVYFEISDFNNLQYIYEEIESTVKKYNEVLFASDSEKLFQNPEFIRLFGKHDIKKQEQYGMFNYEKSKQVDKQIRKLTIEDEMMIYSFEEPIIEFHDNLRSAYETCIKALDKNYVIYGYIDNQTDILGYLIANTFDGQYWDVAFIYVTERARGQGIAKKLARFYADDMNANGHFASYGTPANEISKHVAISAGFEMFSRQYLTKWTSTK